MKKRIQYDHSDYACYVQIEGEDEQFIGYASTYLAAERKCDDFAYDWFSDRHTPEAAAAIVMAAA
jgi:hypothetical protein